MKYFLRSIPTVAYIPTSYIVWHFLSGIPRSTWRIKKVPQSIVAFIFAAMQEKTPQIRAMVVAGLALQRCRKILRDLGIFQATALFFCLAHAPSVCTKTSAARQWQIWSAKWCWFQLPTQWQDGYQIDALMTCTPWAHLFLQKADGSRCFAIWTAELPGWVTPSSAQQVSMPLETLLLQI